MLRRALCNKHLLTYQLVCHVTKCLRVLHARYHHYKYFIVTFDFPIVNFVITLLVISHSITHVYKKFRLEQGCTNFPKIPATSSEFWVMEVLYVRSSTLKGRTVLQWHVNPTAVCRFLLDDCELVHISVSRENNFDVSIELLDPTVPRR